jgi:hypothetical protein
VYYILRLYRLKFQFFVFVDKIHSLLVSFSFFFVGEECCFVNISIVSNITDHIHILNRK